MTATETKSDVYLHSHDLDLGIAVHEQDAIRLGFKWDGTRHSRMQPMGNGQVLYRPEPLSLQFSPTASGGQLKTSDYRRCLTCGEDHEPLVIAFLDDYKEHRDTRLSKLSEKKAKEWEAAGLGRDLYEEVAHSPHSEDDIRRLLKLGPYAEERQAPVGPPMGVADVQQDSDRTETEQFPSMT